MADRPSVSQTASRSSVSRPGRPAFSLLEVIAAVVILAVVTAATVATTTPMRTPATDQGNRSIAADVTALVQTYYVQRGQIATWDRLVEAKYVDADEVESLKRQVNLVDGVVLPRPLH